MHKERWMSRRSFFGRSRLLFPLFLSQKATAENLPGVFLLRLDAPADPFLLKKSVSGPFSAALFRFPFPQQLAAASFRRGPASAPVRRLHFSRLLSLCRQLSGSASAQITSRICSIFFRCSFPVEMMYILVVLMLLCPRISASLAMSFSIP